MLAQFLFDGSRACGRAPLFAGLVLVGHTGLVLWVTNALVTGLAQRCVVSLAKNESNPATRSKASWS